MFRVFLHTHKAKIVYGFCVLAAVVLLIIQDEPVVREAEAGLTLVERLLDITFHSVVTQASNALDSYDDLKAENERLRTILNASINELLQARAIIGAHDRHRRTLTEQRLSDPVLLELVGDVVASNVIARGIDMDRQLLKIDRGSWDGITRGRPVIAFQIFPDGKTQITVVGITWKVFGTHTFVAPITSEDFTLRARVVGADSSMTACTITGLGEDLHYARVHDLEPGDFGKLEIGAKVYSDWGQLDSVYLGGLFLGTVHSDITPVGENPDARRQYKLEVGVDLPELEVVYIPRGK